MQSPTGSPRTSFLARLLSWCVLGVFLAAIAAFLFAGLAALLVFLVLLIPALLLLFVLVLTGRGKISIRVRGTRRERATPPGDHVAELKQNR